MQNKKGYCHLYIHLKVLHHQLKNHSKKPRGLEDIKLGKYSNLIGSDFFRS